MHEIKPVERCRVCGGTDRQALFSLGSQYINDFPLPDHARDGLQVPLELELCLNPACKLVQLRHTAPQSLLYSGNYWYRSGVTQTMRDALANVAEVATKAARLSPGDIVLDIGSNDGTLLRFFPENTLRIGVEPANNLATEENYRGLELIHDFWPIPLMAEHGICNRAKVITALGMFYDLEDPVAFVRAVANALAPNGVFIAQLMCLWNMLQLHDISNVGHEHLEYYSLQSLAHLYEQAGLEIIDIQEVPVNGSSYRILAKRKDSNPRPLPGAFQRMAKAVYRERDYSNPSVYFDFYKRADDIRSKVTNFIHEAILSGKSVWVYGASTKGNTLLQWWDLDTLQITAAAERSPEKWGRVTVGTGIPIVSEDEFRKAKPDFALVFPYTFIDEFMEREKDWLLGGGTFLVPMPEPSLITWRGGSRPFISQMRL